MEGGLDIPKGTLTAHHALLVYKLDYRELAHQAAEGDFPRHYATVNPVLKTVRSARAVRSPGRHSAPS